MHIQHKKNTAYYLSFPAVDSASPASFKTGVSPVDTAYYKDGAGAWTSLAIADTASEIGSTGVYEIDLTAAELNHDQVVIKFAVAGMADTAFLLDMRTELAEDLGNGSGQVSLLTATQASIDAIEVDTNSLNDTKVPQTLNLTASGNIGIDWANVENPTTAVDLSATDIQLCDTITTYTGNTVQTGDAYARLGAPAGASVSADIATVDGIVDSILVDTGTTLDNHLTDIKGTGFVKDTHSLIDIEAYVDVLDDATSGNAKIATDVAAILADTNELQTDDVPGLIAALENVSAADVLTQVNAALDTAISELGVGAPTATPTLRTGLMLLYMATRNKLVVQTSGTDALEIYNDAGTKIASKLLTDDGSDYTEAEMA